MPTSCWSHISNVLNQLKPLLCEHDAFQGSLRLTWPISERSKAFQGWGHWGSWVTACRSSLWLIHSAKIWKILIAPDSVWLHLLERNGMNQSLFLIQTICSPPARMQSRKTLLWNELFEQSCTFSPVTVPVHCKHSGMWKGWGAKCGAWRKWNVEWGM